MKRLVAVLLVAGCASTIPRPQPAPPADVSAELAIAETELERALARPSAQAHPVDCDRAAVLRDNICALAEKICRLADPTVPERCARATKSCLSARERVATTCGIRQG